jgi:hypothetical protein
MGQLEDILKHQNVVRNNIMKSFGAETSEDSLEKSFEDEVNPFEMEAYKSELTKSELDEFEKAKHQDGDMHPNGKWVWRQSANGGKGDWRVAKPSRGGGSSKTTSSAYNEEKFADMDIKEAKKKLVGKNLTFKDYWSDGKGGSVDATGKITNVRLYGKNKQPVASVEFENGDSAMVSLKQIDEGKAVGYDLSLSDVSNKTNTTSSDNVNKLKLNGVDITVKRDPKDKYGYIVEGNGKSVKTQDPSYYNVTKATGLVKKTLADMLGIPLKTTAKKK